MSFNFGTPKSTTGFSLNMNPPTTTTAPGFSFGSGAGDAKSLSKPSTNLFSTPGTTNSTLNFGSNTITPGLSFGTTPASSTTLGAGSASTGLSFAKSPASTNLSFGTPTASSTSASITTSSTVLPTLNFGASSTSAALPKFGASTATSTPSLSLGSATTVSSSGSAAQFGFGSKLPAATSASASFTPILGSGTAVSSSSSSAPTASVAPSTSLSFGVPSATTVTTTTTSSTSSLGVLPNSTTTLTSTTSSIPSTGCMTFSQLEDSINKWTIDLEEQGKFFINQAKQLNAWDSLLISNGEKILNLNNSIERVKQQQHQLDQELDFVLAQQKELEELIRPLEKELVDIPVTDIDRNQMYQFAEIIDSQLKQMSDDLKEIIEHINDSNKDEEINNPVSQISRILNAHMNSLQWIDRNTAQISSHLEQITKIQDSNRRNFALNHSMNHSFNM